MIPTTIAAPNATNPMTGKAITPIRFSDCDNPFSHHKDQQLCHAYLHLSSNNNYTAFASDARTRSKPTFPLTIAWARRLPNHEAGRNNM